MEELAKIKTDGKNRILSLNVQVTAMARKSILHAIRSSRHPSESSFAANNNSQQIPEPVSQVTSREKTKRIVVDMPEIDHMKIKIFATQHGISIKQLVLIALQDAMQDND